MLRLLCITAHPDDEASSFGGTLLLAQERGIQTHILCLTEGRAASHRGSAHNDDELAALRREEFARACRILNATGEVLGYHDAGLDREDFYTVVGDLTERIRSFRPHVVATFGPDGSVTAHTDHGMAGLFTSAAVQAAPRVRRYAKQIADGLKTWQVQKLYYSTANFHMAGRPPVALAPVSARVEIGEERLRRKIEAFRQHTTQSPLFRTFENFVLPRGPFELYHLAATAQVREMKFETDLFDGVVDE